MATLKGFQRWLRSLRALNAQRDALERHASALDGLRVHFDAQQHALEQRGVAIHALEAQFVTQRHAHERQTAALDKLGIQFDAQQHALDQRGVAIQALEAQFGPQRRALEQCEMELRELAAQLRSLRARVESESEQASGVRDGVRLEISGLTSRLDSAARSAESLGSAIRQLEATADSLRARLRTIAPPFPALPDLASDDSAAWFHAAVEAQFRGPIEDIRERLRVYLPFVATLDAAALDLPALDLGCGRGEWLDLLRSEGITAIGIDDNPVSIERCVARGLHAIRCDALEYLRRQSDGAASLVSAFHVVEHLAPETLMALLFEARRVLVPGGLLIVETPNPDNVLVGASSFYLDPTHRHPIPTPLLHTFVEFARFDIIESLALQPDEEMRKTAIDENWPATLTRLLGGPRDAGVIARKPLESASIPS